ncbi:histidine--tRNA ligase cytoplasmic [Prunus yedoensis var. nudiflora]|uniref:histidine--tRNA ligase n=1 Tax=Prunus yedoensis var. nudiflora TaxID=2094558 RepID=A0A314YSU0_PRUYE|nr:histidine--tRNA ligase cytoplasmic [Prunus yedoensis var. nudiflora]
MGPDFEVIKILTELLDELDIGDYEVEEKGLSVETADKIGTFVKERGHPLELLFKLKQEGSSFLENSASIDALNDLEILFKALEKSKCIGKVAFDLSLARGLDYYTGVIYEAVFKGGAQTTRATKTEVLVSVLGDDLTQAAELASELWAAKVKAEYLVNKRVSKHFDRAKESRIPWMIIVGERELNEGVVRLKDIEAAEESIIPRSRIVEELQKRLSS